jgi:hypothetical protein
MYYSTYTVHHPNEAVYNQETYVLHLALHRDMLPILSKHKGSRRTQYASRLMDRPQILESVMQSDP